MKKSRFIQALVLALMILMIYIITTFAPTFFSEKESTYTVIYTDVFNTVTYITGYAESEEAFRKQAELLHERLVEYHQYYDIYENYSDVVNLKVINDSAYGNELVVDEPIITLLVKSKEVYEQTDGKVNVVMGSVLKVWHSYREEGLLHPNDAMIPSTTLLEDEGRFTDINELIINEDTRSVTFLNQEMSLDVGSVAKGYAADQVANYAKELGMENLLISVGGNVVAVGGKVDGSTWNVGIQDPIAAKTGDDKQYTLAVGVIDGCVVTSGDYQRYYTVDGKDYCHIIDSENYMPANRYRSVTVIGKDSLMADALSTALFCMGQEEGVALLDEMDGYEALWIHQDGSTFMTDGFNAYIIK